ncbi:LLM class flavin-dependent oxidoreductase [Dactylosporangium sp. AC04546]|uniref:LLM class flavin-dependent oxidoreductase n=1 Tax=Dactylosporangium sp. AC04546 TaxID=2862460 RepID=UPI001EDF9C72|nr:LLM class flavin-dependent oxidoreductase [Dactylosporangium sp. AC04546]WVK86465.1 LLM class flavin-dependent oxidoreductase [Dactylosporangium sp. AC04546]
MTDASGLRIGLAASCQTVGGADLAAAAEQEVRLIRRARDGGWDSVWVSHHYVTPAVAMPQPAVWLSRLIPETGDMQLGTGIMLLPLPHAVDVAETYGSIDALSDGRLVLGVGLGYRSEEFEAFGLLRKDRVRLFEQNLETLLRLWGRDRDLLTAPPVRHPRPPVVVGAEGPLGIARAARVSDGWLASPRMTRAELVAGMETFTATRRDAGHEAPGTIMLGREVYCAATSAQAQSVADRFLRDKYDVYGRWSGLETDPSVTPERDERFAVGTPEECVAALLPYVHAGIDQLVLRTHWAGMSEQQAAESIDLLSAEVLPALRAAARAAGPAAVPR